MNNTGKETWVNLYKDKDGRFIGDVDFGSKQLAEGNADKLPTYLCAIRITDQSRIEENQILWDNTNLSEYEKCVRDNIIKDLEQRLKEQEEENKKLHMKEFDRMGEWNVREMAFKKEIDNLKKHIYSEDAINRLKAEYFEKGIKAKTENNF